MHLRISTVYLTRIKVSIGNSEIIGDGLAIVHSSGQKDSRTAYIRNSTMFERWRFYDSLCMIRRLRIKVTRVALLWASHASRLRLKDYAS